MYFLVISRDLETQLGVFCTLIWQSDYIILLIHNKRCTLCLQLIGLVLEGSNSRGRSKSRKRPNSSDYAKLEENVSDTLSKGSGKTYIY